MEAIIYTQSTEGITSFNDKDEEIQLNAQEAASLRDSFLKIDQKLIILDSSWLHRFTQRYNLRYRKITHYSPKTFAEVQESILEFLEEIHQIRRNENICPEMIINFDEMAVFFDMIPSHTYEKANIKHPALKTSQIQKKRCTVGLAITAAGEKINPLLIFKGKGARINKLNNFKGYFIKKNINAWMTKAIYLDYLNSVIKHFVLQKRKKEEFKDKKALVIVDNFSGHNLEPEEKKKFEKLGIIIKHLRPYTTSYCQPLDLNVNFLVKKKMKDYWMDWFSNDESQTPRKQTLYGWFAKSWDSITALNIVKAFLNSGIPNDLDGKEDFFSQNLCLLRTKRNSDQPSKTEEIKEEEKEDLEDLEYFDDPYKKFEDLYDNKEEEMGEYIIHESRENDW